MITFQQLKLCTPLNQNHLILLNAISKYLPLYNINTTPQISAFISQCSYESVDFTRLEEHLNYSAEGLQKTFPSHFNTTEAADYERQPEKIANRIYANRMGNGDESSGDGWKYKGRGAIQLTGKSVYQLFSNAISKDISYLGEYLITLDGAVESAAWFFKSNNLNHYIETLDLIGLTKRINGGTIGLTDRICKFDNCIKAMQA